ncbi:hypothetical protein OSB04_014027 [Centaurea solstitialis]|uniref:Uncharacterized protein n=1 Tax=Centaurea solstitialis TaxID=347529 RepID=A0AA38TLX4_9ASTR|nr:hypothetical protein OSB04_014027 [Centaurea solstitialis]
MEIRVFVPLPDRYRMMIRVKQGEVKKQKREILLRGTSKKLERNKTEHHQAEVKMDKNTRIEVEDAIKEIASNTTNTRKKYWEAVVLVVPTRECENYCKHYGGYKGSNQHAMTGYFFHPLLSLGNHFRMILGENLIWCLKEAATLSGIDPLSLLNVSRSSFLVTKMRAISTFPAIAAEQRAVWPVIV